MVISHELIRMLGMYSSNKQKNEVYKSDVPKDILEKFENLNKLYQKSHGKDFVKILHGNEIIDGEKISIKKYGQSYLCYVDRAEKEKIEELKKYNEKKKKETGFDFEFVTFLKG